MAQSLGSAIFTVRGDDTQLQSMFRSIPGLVAQQGRATEQIATRAFGQAGASAGQSFGRSLGNVAGSTAQSFGQIGTSSGQSFSAGIAASTRGLGASIAAPLSNTPATIGAISRATGTAFSDGIRSTTQNISSSIANPLSGVASTIGGYGQNAGRLFTAGIIGSTNQIASSITNPLGTLQGAFGSIGSNSGRLFSTGVLGATGGLGASIAAPLGVLPSSFASVGGSSGRSFASGIISQLGSITGAARSAASQMSAPFINAGRSIGESVRGDIGRGIKYSIGNSVARAGAGLVGAAFDTKNLAEFDAASRKVAQLTSDTKGMEKAAAALSKELRYGTNSTEVLVASYDVLSSGFSKTTDVANILRPAIKATIANQGEAKLERVSDAITSVINSYKSWGYSAKDAEMIVNQMSSTVDAGKIKYGEYASLIGKAASVAASAGISFSDLNTAIAKATISGQKPGAVLAGIPGIITNISKPTKIASETANALGIEFSATALKAKGLLGIMADIAAKTEKLGAAGRSEAIQKLFGSINGKNVATSLITDSGKSSDQTSVGNITKAVNSGSVDKNFKLASGGIKFQEEALKNRVIELDIKLKNGAFGEVLAASMAIAAKAIGGVITAVETLDNWYKKLDPSTQGLVKGIGTIAVSAIAVAAALTGVGVVIGLIGPPLAAAAAIAGGFAVNIGYVALAAAPLAIPILAASAAVYGLGKAFGATDAQAFAASLTVAGTALALLFGPAAISAIVAGTIAVVTGFSGIAVAAGAALIPLAPWIAAAAGIAAALYGLYKVYEMFKPQVDSFVGEVINGFKSALSSAVDFVIKIAEPFRGLVEWYAKLTIAGWSFTAEAVKAWFGMWQRIGAAVIDYGGGVLGSVVNFGSKVWSAFGGIKTKVYEFWFGMWDGIKGAATSATGFVTGKVSGFAGSTIGSFKSIASGVAGSIDKWLQSMGLLPKGMSITGVAINLLKSTAVGQFASALLSVLKFKDGSIGAFDAIGNKIKEMIAWIIEIPNKIQDAANSLNVFNGGQPAAKSGGKGSAIVATGYTPGEGNTRIEGGKIDYKERYLDKTQPVIATRTTGAINGIPDGAQVEITDPKTNRKTTATVRDRGPLQRGVDVDLTTQVFKNLGIEVDSKGMPKQGKVDLQIKVLSVPSGKVADKYDLGMSGGGYYDKTGTKYIGKYGREISSGGDKGFFGGIGDAIGKGFNAVKGLFGGGDKAVASPIATKSIAQAVKDVVPGLGNHGAPRPGRTHAGTDFNGPVGTPVRAPHDGIAEYKNLGRTGSAVIIKSVDGVIMTRLLHLTDESKRFFANGPRPVKAGEQIGEIGAFGAKYRDGTVTGSKTHVHHETYINKKLVDTAKFLSEREKTMVAPKPAPKVATTTSNQPFASSRKVEDATESLKTIDTELAKQQAFVNPDKDKIAKLVERRKAAQKRLDRATQDQTKKRVKDQYKQSEKAVKAEIRDVEVQAELINSEEKNQLSKAIEQGEIDQIKASAIQRRQALASVIAKLKAKYANSPAFIIRLNKVDTGLVDKPEIIKAQLKPKLITTPKIAEADSNSQRRIDDAATKLNEASTKLANLKSQTNPASAKEILNAENLVKNRTKLFDRAVIDAGKQREKDRAKKIKESAEKEVESIQAELSIIASNARLAISRVDRSTDKGKAEIVRIEANRVAKEKALISKLTALRTKNSGNSKLVQQLNDLETNINENAAPKVTKDKLTDVGILEQQIKAISDGVASKNQLTDLAVVRNRVTKEVGADVKAKRGADEAKRLAALLPKIAELKQKYLKNPEVTTQINALESRVVDKQSDATASTKAATSARFETIKTKVDGIVRDRDRVIATVENNVTSGGTTREAGDQAILSIKIKYNNELQRSIPLIKAFKSAASSREDIRAAEDLLDLTAKNNAETISANKGDKLVTVKLSIDNQLTAQSNRSEDINNSLSRGEIDQIEAQRQQLANKQIYNDELQKTLSILEYIRSISKGDGIKLVDDEIRRVIKNDAETKAAQTEFRKIEVTENITKIDRIIRTGERRQTAIKEDAILNKPDRDNTSFLDPSVAIERQQSQSMLIIRQQTAKQLQAEVELLKEKRELAKDDPGEVERINEKLAAIRQYQIEVKTATDAQKEADRAASVAGQATKQINEQLGVSFKDLFTGILSGAQSINSIFNNLLNKIADIGINAILNQVFGDISGKGAGGGILDGLIGVAGKVFGFKEGGSIDGAPAISNFAGGGSVGAALGLAGSISAALKAEGAGSKGRVIVANTDEYVLDGQQTKIFQRMSASGDWAQMERIYNYSSGGAVGSGVQANTFTRSSSIDSFQSRSVGITIDRINDVSYVSFDQVQAIVDAKLPTAARAGAAMATNSLSNTAYRQANGIN